MFSSSLDWLSANFDYLELVTGLKRAQLYELYEAAAGEEFLQGLAWWMPTTSETVAPGTCLENLAVPPTLCERRIS